MPEIKKILVANRGEIALRVLRTANEMGISTVAVYSEADRNALHVRFADEAVCIGPPASSESYLRGDKIIKVCQELGVDAVHPGYGFLSENAEFSEMCEKSGIIFIGPSPYAIRTMGDKLEAKRAVKKYDIPMIPGTEDAISDPEEAKKLAKAIGYPILIKASAGGGGKGMRVVENPEILEEQMKLAISEATSAFGDGSVFIEKYIESNKHIEVQVLGDQKGNIVYLFERECTIQRRHQKVIEEAPSMVISPEKRKALGEAAVGVARACDYVGAGTVEFIYDSGDFYFLEMNTRLQVEHPVTEFITGKDLVREQILIAQGEPLSFSQDEIKLNGHSFEVRVYAEDPKNNFRPDIGTLQTYVRPQGPGIRVDDGFEEGMEIPIYYDPMIAKLTVHAETREAARQRMIRAIKDYQITGIETTLEFCKYVMRHPVFIDGSFDTKFVEHHFTPEDLEQADAEEKVIAALTAAQIQTRHNPKSKVPSISDNGTAGVSPWRLRAK